jgi:predicted HAD superfamily Cof-like phosphohydrolase
MEEELAETEQAMFADDLPAIADGLADLIYVAIGTAVAYGIDLRPVWAAVQAANLGKLGGTVREDGKRMKPPGWKPPDVAAILAGQSPIMEIDQS